AEPVVFAGIDRLRGDEVDSRELRCFHSESADEVRHRFRLALGLDDDAVAVVEDEATEGMAPRERVNEGTKADALDHPRDPETPPLDLTWRRQRHRLAPAWVLSGHPPPGVPDAVVSLAPFFSGPTTDSSASATCSSAPLMSFATGPMGSVCFSIALTPNVTRPSVCEILRRVAAIAIR